MHNLWRDLIIEVDAGISRANNVCNILEHARGNSYYLLQVAAYIYMWTRWQLFTEVSKHVCGPMLQSHRIIFADVTRTDVNNQYRVICDSARIRNARKRRINNVVLNKRLQIKYSKYERASQITIHGAKMWHHQVCKLHTHHGHPAKWVSQTCQKAR